MAAWISGPDCSAQKYATTASKRSSAPTAVSSLQLVPSLKSLRATADAGTRLSVEAASVASQMRLLRKKRPSGSHQKSERANSRRLVVQLPAARRHQHLMRPSLL